MTNKTITTKDLYEAFDIGTIVGLLTAIITIDGIALGFYLGGLL